MFKIRSDFVPMGDQPHAISEITQGIRCGKRRAVLQGVTGSGKTFTLAHIIKELGLPTLVISHNKTLAAQLYNEFKDLFPENAVEYFVSFYDYYQPEAYLPASDTYISKESEINSEIEKLRFSAANAVLTRKDVIVVASVSCIYGVGIAPEEYKKYFLVLEPGQKIGTEALLDRLVKMGYERTKTDLAPGKFRLKGDVLDIFAPGYDVCERVELFGSEIESVSLIHPITSKTLSKEKVVRITPAKMFLSDEAEREMIITAIKEEMEARCLELTKHDHSIEAYRLRQRTLYDMELLEEFGWCQGIENYSRYLSHRKPGEPPYTLMDYFPKDFLLIIDESHVSIPQVRGMHNGDWARKKNLVDYGWRLPSAFDNRPLNFEEFWQHAGKVVFSSATPADFELEKADMRSEMVVRPTGLLDPRITVKPVEGQVDDLIARIREVVERKGKILVSTLTKRLAQDITDHFVSIDIRARYLHSDIETLERIQILNDLQEDKFDCLIGINLLREGLDLPQVELVAILDADKEGFLRSKTSLIQTMGRAARNVNARVMLYADVMTDSLKAAIGDNERKRAVQEQYNKDHGITPQTAVRKTKASLGFEDYHDFEAKAPRTVTKDFELINALDEFGIIDKKVANLDIEGLDFNKVSKTEKKRFIKVLKKQMMKLANILEFEQAALLRDKINLLEAE